MKDGTLGRTPEEQEVKVLQDASYPLRRSLRNRGARFQRSPEMAFETHHVSENKDCQCSYQRLYSQQGGCSQFWMVVALQGLIEPGEPQGRQEIN